MPQRWRLILNFEIIVFFLNFEHCEIAMAHLILFYKFHSVRYIYVLYLKMTARNCGTKLAKNIGPQAFVAEPCLFICKNIEKFKIFPFTKLGSLMSQTLEPNMFLGQFFSQFLAVILSYRT